MIYKSFNVAITFRILLFGCATAGLVLLIYTGNYLLAAPVAIVAVIAVLNLIYYLNQINRKVAFFFDAVTNDDSSLHYSEQVQNKSLKMLHQNLNKLNRHIADIKITNEHNVRFFQEMLKSSATGLLAVDEKGYIEQINDSALEFMGVLQIAHLDLLQQKNAELYQHMMSIHPGQSRVIKISQGTGMQMFSLKVAVLIFGTNRYRLFSLSDIKNEIEENELDSWQKLISVMTHEIMNSVAPITSLSNTLSRIFIRNKQPLPVSDITDTHIANVIHGLEVIENTGQGLMRFVADYRKLTKIPIPAFKPIPVAEWLISIRMLMECRLTEENIQFNLDYRGSKQEFIGDEKLLTQVMINILNNAADALSETEDKRISIHVSENSQGKLIIETADNGKGIPAEELDKIFIPFYTTKENGSGIGLSLSRKIVRLHRGSISVVSQPKVETVFTIVL